MKKIITISYTADFSRFFKYSIEGIEPKVEWLNLSIHPSSHLYSSIHEIKSVFLPWEIRKKNFGGSSDLMMSSKEIEGMINYHLYDTDNQVLLIRVLNRYINYYHELLSEFEPDLIVLSGDSRLPVKALKFVAKNIGIQLLHFEQGPLNTTILDSQGVNANCSFRLNNFTSSDSSSYIDASQSKPDKWKGYKKYRTFDLLLERSIFFGYTELSKIKLTKNKGAKRIYSSSGLGYILLVLQVPEDANMRCHSPFFSNHAEIVKEVYYSLPDGMSLLIREHPLYAGKYEDDLYNFAMKEGIAFDRNKDLLQSINRSACVVVNNSTVGLETLLAGKPLVVLGDSYYDNTNFVYKYNGESLGNVILNAINNPIDKKLVRERINYFYNCCFLKGHFRDLCTNNFQSISSFLLSHLNKKN